MTAVSTRVATSSDIPIVAALFDAYRQFYAQKPDLALATNFIRERMEKDQSVVLVAQNSSSETLGFCQLYPSFCSVEAVPIYVLYDLFVQVGARKSGAGMALMLAAEKQAIQDGRARMDLSTAKTNRFAQALYEKLGWVRDEEFFTYSKHLSG